MVDFAAEDLKVALLPWQSWLLVHALELLPDGSLRFRNVVVLVARQNGKSTLSQVLALWAMFVRGARTVLGTAQDLDTAEEVWQGAVDLVEELDENDEPVRPELYEMYDRVIGTNGKKALVLTTGERYKVKAANRKAGRGLTGDLIILDELREHQNWDAWGAISKTTMARPDAQVWCLSNAGDITSVVLRYLRMKAHEALGDPDGIVAKARIAEPTVDDLDEDFLDELNDDDEEDLTDEDLEVAVDDLFLAEWSGAPGCSKDDREQWAQSNPALGYTIQVRTVASACRTDPEWVFRTEVLCQWPEGGLEGPFKPGSWEATLNTLVETPGGPVLAREDWIVGKVVACVAVAADRSRAHVAIAGRRADGVPQAEIHASRPGVEWVRGWLHDRRDLIEQVTGQSAGDQAAELMGQLAADRGLGIPVVPWQGSNLVGAHGFVFDLVRDGRVRHNPQMALDLAAASAVKKQLAGGWVVNLAASPTDAAPLQGFIGALWLLHRPPPVVHLPATAAAVASSDSSTKADPSRVTSMTADLASVHF